MRRPDLVPDCGSCAALCCVAFSFDRSAEFGIDKAAGERCRHLTRENLCAIHGELVARGFSGCAGYECHGAGPRATRLFAGTRADDRHRIDVFLILRDVHELLWLLTEAARLCPAAHPDLAARLAREIEALDRIEPATVVEADLRPHRESTRALLRQVGHSLGGRRGLAVVA